MSTEKAARQHEQPFEAGHEVWQGDLGVQAFNEICTKRKIEANPHRFELSALEKIRGRIYGNACESAGPPLLW